MVKKLGRVTAVLSLTSALFIVASAPANAAGAQVTRGEVGAFAAALNDAAYAQYQDISGHAQMVRTADGKTIVAIHVEGLAPNTTYASHVHKQACGNGDADGHYKLDTSISATLASNEIWPGPFTTDDEGIGNGWTKVDHLARSEAVSVVVHAPVTGAKIGCADLS
ncbi:MAG: hypothetical protein ABR548_09960 [Actinomycetota bacterium]|nr:hypothetical protein [Actinomycetota bacterium]